MRLRVALTIERPVTLPINHQHLLTGVVYRFLESADADYARFLHEEGYAISSAAGEEDEREHRRFKLFVFSPVRAKYREARGAGLLVRPGPAEWLICSPVEKFLTEFATGLLARGTLDVGAVSLPISRVETLPEPVFAETMGFTCLSPVVVSVTEMQAGRRQTRYLLPDDPEFGERVRRNLLGKYTALYGRRPAGEHLQFCVNSAYIECNSRGGTKLVDYKGIKIRGVQAPFTLSGSVELMRVGYECGVGEKNAAGFGMIAVDRRGLM